jgi:hypothetical protein
MPYQFTSGVEYIGPVNAGPMATWVSGVPYEDWPQQHRLPDGKVRPAMITDVAWRGYGVAATNTMSQLVTYSPEKHRCPMVSVVMPGHNIPEHRDLQDPNWIYRIHVPLQTNPDSKFIVDGVEHHMEVGSAYRVNTLAPHAVVNNGDTPRVHFMFDVYE